MVQRSTTVRAGAARPSRRPRVGLLRELADPLRLRVVDRLGHRGPATVSQLAGELGVPLPQLSNHLRRLRESGLVRVERSGRQAVYQLGDPGLEPCCRCWTGSPPPAAAGRAVAGRLPDLLRPPGRAARGRPVPRPGRPSALRSSPTGRSSWARRPPMTGRPRGRRRRRRPGRRRLAFSASTPPSRCPPGRRPRRRRGRRPASPAAGRAHFWPHRRAPRPGARLGAARPWPWCPSSRRPGVRGGRPAVVPSPWRGPERRSGGWIGGTPRRSWGSGGDRLPPVASAWARPRTSRPRARRGSRSTSSSRKVTLGLAWASRHFLVAPGHPADVDGVLLGVEGRSRDYVGLAVGPTVASRAGPGW